MDIEKTLAERGNRYGDFAEHAIIAQALKDAMWCRDGWHRLTPAMAQALEVIQDKIARILNGDPTYADNWHDIIGYARLVEKTLTPEPVMTTKDIPQYLYTKGVADMINAFNHEHGMEWPGLVPERKSHTQD